MKKPKPGQQLSLFESQPEQTGTLEQIASEQVRSVEYESYEQLVGSLVKELASFRSGGRRALNNNYNAVQSVWYGLQNMATSSDGHIGVPDQMFRASRLADICALFSETYQLKEGYHYNRPGDPLYIEVAKSSLESFGGNISKVVQNGYKKYQGIRTLKNKDPHKLKSGELKNGMQSTIDEDKQQFLSTFKLPLRFPEYTDDFEAKKFRDPNFGEKNDYVGVDIYIRHIAEKFASIYIRTGKAIIKPIQ